MILADNIILGIETSCDETSLCLIKKTNSSLPQILCLQTFSQEKIFEAWGGVVPEIASRNHHEKLVPLLKDCFRQAQLQLTDITAVAVTTSPGLLGPLLTGLNIAKTLSLISGCALIPINHLYAHLNAITLTTEVSYPFLGMLISGGHSAYFLVAGADDFQFLGSTIDDAAGEAFDKGGKILNLPYPAGKKIDDFAKKGNPKKFSFPIGLEKEKTAMLSFSGLKTALKNKVIESPQLIKDHNHPLFWDLCASYQEAILQALILKLNVAQNIVGKDLPVVVGGGVAANSALRLKLPHAYFVDPLFCTDNAAMIAWQGVLNWNQRISHPACLSLDAKDHIINKKNLHQKKI